MRSQGTMREWDGMDKRDQGYSRPGTGGMSHEIPGHATAKSDNPLKFNHVIIFPPPIVADFLCSSLFESCFLLCRCRHLCCISFCFAVTVSSNFAYWLDF